MAVGLVLAGVVGWSFVCLPLALAVGRAFAAGHEPEPGADVLTRR